MLAPPRAKQTILYGGLTVAVLDAIEAMVFFGLRGASPRQIWQYVASAVLGRASFQAGMASLVLGLALHVAVALSIATVFYLVARQFPALLARPVRTGLGFGVIAYAVMTWTVVPLTRAAWGHPKLPVLINGVVGHALLIGLPIALWAAWSARRATPRAT